MIIIKLFIFLFSFNLFCNSNIYEEAIEFKKTVDLQNTKEINFLEHYFYFTCDLSCQLKLKPKLEKRIQSDIDKITELLSIKNAIAPITQEEPFYGTWEYRSSIGKLIGTSEYPGILSKVLDITKNIEKFSRKLDATGQEVTVYKTFFVYAIMELLNKKNIGELLENKNFRDNLTIFYPANVPSYIPEKYINQISLSAKVDNKNIFPAEPLMYSLDITILSKILEQKVTQSINLCKSQCSYHVLMIPNAGYIYGGTLVPEKGEKVFRGMDCTSFIAYLTKTPQLPTIILEYLSRQDICQKYCDKKFECSQRYGEDNYKTLVCDCPLEFKDNEWDLRDAFIKDFSMLEALERYNVIELDPEVCYSDIFDILTPGDIVLWRGKANHAFIYLKKGSKPGTAHILELTREDDFSKEGFEIVDLYLYRPETRVYILRNK